MLAYIGLLLVRNKSAYIDYIYDINKTIKANSISTIDLTIKYKK